MLLCIITLVAPDTKYAAVQDEHLIYSSPNKTRLRKAGRGAIDERGLGRDKIFSSIALFVRINACRILGEKTSSKQSKSELHVSELSAIRYL